MITKTCQHINLDYLDMMTDGDGEMRDTMLGMLMDELPAEVSKMRPLLTDSNWGELREVSHKLKSTLAFIGNDVMTEANKEIELLTKNGQASFQRIASLLTIIEDQLSGVLDELRESTGSRARSH